jgi:two-component system, OmpR family, phosphate regulon response regulator PhoB
MSEKQVLVVEDEEAIRDLLRFRLSRAGYAVVPAASGAEARAAIADRQPDVIIMDWMLPDISGLELTRQLKREPSTREIPIIMVTARAQEDDRVTGLEGGADDYVVKPFSPRELLARIKAVMRRGAFDNDEVLTAGRLVLDAASHRVTVGGADVELAPTEFRLLKFFMEHPDRVYSRAQVLDRVWGGSVYIEERTVDVHIRRLRQALTPHGYDKLIRTVRGAGYGFSPDRA